MCSTLIALRSARGLSQSQLAGRAGLTQPAVSRIERGLSFSAVTLHRLLEALDASDHERAAALAELVGRTAARSHASPGQHDDAIQGAA